MRTIWLVVGWGAHWGASRGGVGAGDGFVSSGGRRRRDKEGGHLQLVVLSVILVKLPYLFSLSVLSYLCLLPHCPLGLLCPTHTRTKWVVLLVTHGESANCFIQLQMI